MSALVQAQGLQRHIVYTGILESETCRNYQYKPEVTDSSKTSCTRITEDSTDLKSTNKAIIVTYFCEGICLSLKKNFIFPFTHLNRLQLHRLVQYNKARIMLGDLVECLNLIYLVVIKHVVKSQ
jgi:hypothetical protein